MFRGTGCRECRQTGYRGRLGIFELMMIDDQIRELIVHRKSAGDILEAARATGFRLMREDGIAKVREGITTIDEIVRTTKVDAMAIAK